MDNLYLKWNFMSFRDLQLYFPYLHTNQLKAQKIQKIMKAEISDTEHLSTTKKIFPTKIKSVQQPTKEWKPVNKVRLH